MWFCFFVFNGLFNSEIILEVEEREWYYLIHSGAAEDTSENPFLES